MQPLQLCPAINLRAGRAVQVAQTRPDGSDVVGLDLGEPVALARRYADAGARRLMITDLDGVHRSGDNLDHVGAVRAACPGTTITLAGGLRDEATVESALSTGIDRVQVATTAVESPEWAARLVRRFGPEAICVALDVLEGELATHSRTVKKAGAVKETVAALEQAGVRRFVVRCLASDGRLTGPNYELLGEVCAVTRSGCGSAVVSCGGIAGLEDIRQLRGLVPIGLEGAVVGTALYQGLFSLPDAIAVAEGERPLTLPIH